eukprot:COSAG03_NODE_341_length_8828_cov_77.724940_6_plen_268_part_00
MGHVLASPLPWRLCPDWFPTTVRGNVARLPGLRRYDPERKAPQIDIDISSFMPGSSAGFGNGAGGGSGAGGGGDTYVVSGTTGHLRASARKVTWRYFDPAKAEKHKMWLWSGGLDAPEKRIYPGETLDWVEEHWDVDQAKLKNAVGYTLESLQEGQERLYNNVHAVLTTGAERLIQPWQSRKQVAVMEEAHRQNPLPRKPQSLTPQLSLDAELELAVRQSHASLCLCGCLWVCVWVGVCGCVGVWLPAPLPASADCSVGKLGTSWQC